jgi:N-acetylglucosamine malate deacetylase 2
MVEENIVHYQKTLAVFAHPDDEAFGPGGILALLAKDTEVNLMCVTDGGAVGWSKDLASRRRAELKRSAKVLGIKEVIFLDYPDGSLNNNVYHQIAKEIQEVVRRLKPQRLITFEPRGVSGHLDHIAVSMISSYVFRENKDIKELWYFCELERKRARKLRDHYFIYFPEGYRKAEIDRVVDTSSVYQIQVKAMRAHQSQTKDAERIISKRKFLPKEEYFLVKKRS